GVRDGALRILLVPDWGEGWHGVCVCVCVVGGGWHSVYVCVCVCWVGGGIVCVAGEIIEGNPWSAGLLVGLVGDVCGVKMRTPAHNARMHRTFEYHSTP